MDMGRRHVTIKSSKPRGEGVVDNPDQHFDDSPATQGSGPAVQTTNRGLWLAMGVGAMAAILLTLATIL